MGGVREGLRARRAEGAESGRWEQRAAGAEGGDNLAASLSEEAVALSAGTQHGSFGTAACSDLGTTSN